MGKQRRRHAISDTKAHTQTHIQKQAQVQHKFKYIPTHTTKKMLYFIYLLFHFLVKTICNKTVFELNTILRLYANEYTLQIIEYKNMSNMGH